MKLILTALLFTMMLSTQVQAQTRDQYFCDASLGKLPILQDGRVKPLLVHAKEMIKYMTGKSKVDGLDAVTAYCLLALQGMQLPNGLKVTARVDHIDAKKFLDLTQETKTIPLSDLIEEIPRLRREIQKVKVQGAKEKALSKLLNQTMLYQQIIKGENWLVAALTNDRVDWIPIGAFLNEQKIKEAKTKSDQPFRYVLELEAMRFIKLQGNTHIVEYYFTKANLPTLSLLITLLSLAFLTLFKRFTIALVFSSLTVILQFTLITLRVYISGRAPITNMYETVMFSGFGALLLSMVVGHLKKEKVFIYVGLMYNACTLMMMNFATGMLSASISPLVPVLRDNFWLSTHVTLIIMSYGALALSWVLANTVLIKKAITSLSKKDENYYSDLIYTCLKYGTIMLGAGIILGGVWADYSWGRFWGWDPKETWSLIAFIIYMAILHGRATSWIPAQRFTTLVAAAFMSVMMAWFGVNYILASGLHSYGFSEGGAIFLGSFFLIQIVVLIITTLKIKSASRA
jgi:cytochrome c-type biogenesis protein CcsB